MRFVASDPSARRGTGPFDSTRIRAPPPSDGHAPSTVPKCGSQFDAVEKSRQVIAPGRAARGYHCGWRSSCPAAIVSRQARGDGMTPWAAKETSMGLWDFVKGELIDIVQWLDATQDTLVVRFE